MDRTLTSKSVFAGEFPLTAEFRSGPRYGKRSYEDWVDQQNMPEGFPVDLQSNVLRFAPENYKYANKFAADHPETMVLSTWRAASGVPKGASDDGDPLGVSVIEFPGHWVLSPGTTLASSISSDDDRLAVRSGENMRKGPALLVEADDSGNKKWENYEYVLITDVSDKTIEVKREYNGSPEARNFPQNTHVAPMPWDERNRKPYTDWFFNFSEFCPKDPKGRTAMDVILRDMLEPLENGGPLENIGGLDLASGPLTVNPSNADYDLDGSVDSDAFYRDGIKTFYERIRNTLGPDRVLITSLDYDYLEYINGVNQEGLASPDDPWDEVAETVNEVLAWKRMAKLPMVSLAFQQHMNKEEDLLRVQMSRLLNGYSACLGLAADIETGSGSDALDAIKRIELYKGDEKEAHWLGKGVGVKRPASMAPNLLNNANGPTDWDSMLPALSILRGELFVDGNELVLRPDRGDFPGYVTLDLNFELEKEKSDFTVFMEARSDDDQALRKILLPRVSVPVDTGPLRADITNKAYLPLTFYVRGAQRGSVTIDFRFGSGGDVRFRSLSVHAAADTLACEFERGVVLVNPSLEDVSFDLPKIFPGRRGYRRLTASEPKGASDIPDKYRPQLRQAMELNNGERVENPKSLKVPQRNALFLIADAITANGAVDVSSSFSPPSESSENREPDMLANDLDGRDNYSEDGDGTNAHDADPVPAPTPKPTKTPKPKPRPTPEPTNPEPEPTFDPTEGSEPTPEPTKRPKPPPTPTPTKRPRPPPTPSPTKRPKPQPTPQPTKQEPEPTLDPTDGSGPEPEATYYPSETTEPTITPEDVWTSVPEDAGPDVDEPHAGPEAAALSNVPTKNISKGDVGVIVAFVFVFVAVVGGVFVAWRKLQTSRQYVRQINEPEKRGGNLGETVVMMETASSDGDGCPSPEIPETKAGCANNAVPLHSQPSMAARGIESGSNAAHGVEVLVRSDEDAAHYYGTREETVEAGLWEDSVSFDTPTFDPKEMS